MAAITRAAAKKAEAKKAQLKKKESKEKETEKSARITGGRGETPRTPPTAKAGGTRAKATQQQKQKEILAEKRLQELELRRNGNPESLRTDAQSVSAEVVQPVAMAVAAAPAADNTVRALSPQVAEVVSVAQLPAVAVAVVPSAQETGSRGDVIAARVDDTDDADDDIVDAPEGQKKAAGVCFICKQSGHKKAECPDVECFRCKKKGHIAANCGECWHCHKTGHRKRECPLFVEEAKTRKCFTCKKPGHIAVDCPFSKKVNPRQMAPMPTGQKFSTLDEIVELSPDAERDIAEEFENKNEGALFCSLYRKLTARRKHLASENKALAEEDVKLAETQKDIAMQRESAWPY